MVGLSLVVRSSRDKSARQASPTPADTHCACNQSPNRTFSGCQKKWFNLRVKRNTNLINSVKLQFSNLTAGITKLQGNKVTGMHSLRTLVFGCTIGKQSGGHFFFICKWCHPCELLQTSSPGKRRHSMNTVYHNLQTNQLLVLDRVRDRRQSRFQLSPRGLYACASLVSNLRT